MLVIDQSDRTRQEEQDLSKYINNFEMKMDLDSIYTDLLKLQNMSVKNKYDAKNINKLIKYLKSLEKEVLSHENDLLPMSWGFSNNYLVSKPIKMLNIPEYGIISADYFKPDNGYTVRIDLEPIADAIAYELSYTDFMDGDELETFDSIDKKLKGASIVGVNPIELLKEVYLEDRPYIFGRMKKINSSTYYDKRNKCMQDYFYEEVEQKENYNLVIEQSCIKAASLIARAISHSKDIKFMCKKTDFKLLSVSAREITFNIDCTEQLINNWESKFKETGISIRAFGRTFVYEPAITIF